jgi:hypothetical protein
MSLSQSQTCISSENLFSLQGNNSSVYINCNKKLKNHKGLKIHNSKCHPQAESSPSANPVDTSDQFIDMLQMIVMKIVMKILKMRIQM